MLILIIMSDKQYCKQYGALMANPDRLAEHKAYQKAYRDQHKERLNLYHRERRAKQKKQYESPEATFLRNAQISLDNDIKAIHRAKQHVKILDYARKVIREVNTAYDNRKDKIRFL